MKNRSLSLTGATGFLGWHIAEAFRDAGWSVRAIVRPGSRKALPDGVGTYALVVHNSSGGDVAFTAWEMLTEAR